jgi:hypothetical protein
MVVENTTAISMMFMSTTEPSTMRKWPAYSTADSKIPTVMD